MEKRSENEIVQNMFLLCPETNLFTFLVKKQTCFVIIKNTFFRGLFPPEATARRSPTKSGWKKYGWQIFGSGNLPTGKCPDDMFLAGKCPNKTVCWPENFPGQFFSGRTFSWPDFVGSAPEK